MYLLTPVIASDAAGPETNRTWFCAASGATCRATPYASGLTGTAVTDSTVVSGTTYYYRVTAVGPGGESVRSNEAQAKAR